MPTTCVRQSSRGQNFRRRADYLGRHPLIAVRDDLAVRVAVVQNRLEDLDPFARNPGAPQAADQFLALARKHRAADHFDPADIA
jgi:hypothetical protein